MKRKIMWVSQHLEINTINGKLEEPEDTPTVVDEDGEMQEAEVHNVISTPFGFWRVDDVMNPYKQFKLWMAHTNFTITEKIAKVIKSLPGVEVLAILTRYRFLIGVGEMFDIRNVRVSIETALKCTQDELSLINNEEIKNKVEDLKNRLSKTSNRYAIYVFPNGNIEHITSKDGLKKFKEKLLLYQNAVDHSAGILIEDDYE